MTCISVNIHFDVLTTKFAKSNFYFGDFRNNVLFNFFLKHTEINIHNMLLNEVKEIMHYAYFYINLLSMNTILSHDSYLNPNGCGSASRN